MVSFSFVAFAIALTTVKLTVTAESSDADDSVFNSFHYTKLISLFASCDHASDSALDTPFSEHTSALSIDADAVNNEYKRKVELSSNSRISDDEKERELCISCSSAGSSSSSKRSDESSSKKGSSKYIRSFFRDRDTPHPISSSGSSKQRSMSSQELRDSYHWLQRSSSHEASHHRRPNGSHSSTGTASQVLQYLNPDDSSVRGSFINNPCSSSSTDSDMPALVSCDALRRFENGQNSDRNTCENDSPATCPQKSGRSWFSKFFCTCLET